MRYIFSCKLCEFSGDATDLHGLGSQINTHASSCHGDLVVMLEGKQNLGDSGIGIPVEPLERFALVTTSESNG